MDGNKRITSPTNGVRIAKNTLALYFRMFFLMLISLFTARIVLNVLGVENKGIYSAVASFVSAMAVITNSISTPISRFITVGIGKGDSKELEKIFSTANGLLLLAAVIIFLIAEPLGMWYIGNVMNLPEGKVGIARWVFQFSLLTFLVSIISIPYNVTIFSHEKMGVYGVIGVVEGLCKLLVAVLIKYSPIDRLVYYSILLFLVNLLVRFLYVAYCRKAFPETRAGFSLDRKYLFPMFEYTGWNSLLSGTQMLNTQGLTLLLNYFFGVVFNTMRDIATNVENMVRQFVQNVLVSFYPQITKSYVSGDREYSFELACKGCKYAFLIIFLLGVPFMFETESILTIWLSDIVPDGTSLFTKLTIVCLLSDVMLNPLSNVVMASGRIRKFYSLTFLVTLLAFPMTWIMYHFSCPAYSCYLAYIATYLLCDVVRLLIMRKELGFPLKMFFREVIVKLAPVVVITVFLTWIVWNMMQQGIVRLLAICVTDTVSVLACVYFFGLGKAEKQFVESKVTGIYSSLRKRASLDETPR